MTPLLWWRGVTSTLRQEIEVLPPNRMRKSALILFIGWYGRLRPRKSKNKLLRAPRKVAVMTDPSLTEIAAELYSAPPTEFVSTRDARAKQVADRQLASQVKALRKPSIAAWVMNLFATERSDRLAQALQLAEELREAQDGSRAAFLDHRWSHPRAPLQGPRGRHPKRCPLLHLGQGFPQCSSDRSSSFLSIGLTTVHPGVRSDEGVDLELRMLFQRIESQRIHHDFSRRAVGR